MSYDIHLEIDTGGPDPDNGWGDYKGALEYLEKLLTACKNHPRATIRVSW